jgi:hypothetical protein
MLSPFGKKLLTLLSPCSKTIMKKLFVNDKIKQEKTYYTDDKIYKNIVSASEIGFYIEQKIFTLMSCPKCKSELSCLRKNYPAYDYRCQNNHMIQLKTSSSNWYFCKKNKTISISKSKKVLDLTCKTSPIFICLSYKITKNYYMINHVKSFVIIPNKQDFFHFYQIGKLKNNIIKWSDNTCVSPLNMFIKATKIKKY